MAPALSLAGYKRITLRLGHAGRTLLTSGPCGHPPTRKPPRPSRRDPTPSQAATLREAPGNLRWSRRSTGGPPARSPTQQKHSEARGSPSPRENTPVRHSSLKGATERNQTSVPLREPAPVHANTALRPHQSIRRWTLGISVANHSLQLLCHLKENMHTWHMEALNRNDSKCLTSSGNCQERT